MVRVDRPPAVFWITHPPGLLAVVESPLIVSSKPLRSHWMVPVLVLPFMTTLPLPKPFGMTWLARFRTMLTLAALRALKVVVPVQSFAGLERPKFPLIVAGEPRSNAYGPVICPEMLANALLPLLMRLSLKRVTVPATVIAPPKR